MIPLVSAADLSLEQGGRVSLPITVGHLLPGIIHSRTSCSDNDNINKYRHYPSGATRCVRCGLLEAIRQYPDGRMVYDESEYTVYLGVNFTWNEGRNASKYG